MAYLETLLSDVKLPLRVAGYPVYSEFDLQEGPVPDHPFFLTIAVKSVNSDAPIPFRGGVVIPMPVVLRFRLHGKVRGQPDVLRARWETAILPILLSAELSITDIELKEIVYQKQINRYVCEANVTVPALLIHYPYEEDSSA